MSEQDATDKDIAEFYRLCLLCRAAERDEVRAWADSVILASATAPEWAVDVSRFSGVCFAGGGKAL